ncbi:MAG TPA: hypothetical protein VLV86_11080, partial [Vicinamibacterales bacterium]|nr:hypothetical protein [Vicinamibacterales bacterium]
FRARRMRFREFLASRVGVLDGFRDVLRWFRKVLGRFAGIGVGGSAPANDERLPRPVSTGQVGHVRESGAVFRFSS